VTTAVKIFAGFGGAVCHVDGCTRRPTTYWRSCYADTMFCEQHAEIVEMIEVEEIDLSCCWYPFAWQAPGGADGE
jgi:hypothetical protein